MLDDNAALEVEMFDVSGVGACINTQSPERQHGDNAQMFTALHRVSEELK